MDPNSSKVVITDTLNDESVVLISLLTGRNAVFTAFDVTKQLRQEHPTMNVPHKDVKEMVLEEWKNTFCDEYERTLTDLTTGQASFVYHPENVSPLTHPLAVQDTVQTTDDDDDDDDTLDNSNLTVEKRLNIGKIYLDRMGLKAGHLVNVETTNGDMLLTKVSAPSVGTLVVNSDGRLRIGSTMLTKAFNGLPRDCEVLISSDNSTIIVRSVD